MATSGQALATRFDQATNDFERCVAALTDEQWHRTCPNTGWPVGVAAHHVAEGVGSVSMWLESVATGKDAPFDFSQLDNLNAEHAKRAASCTREETVSLLRQQAAVASKVLRGLSDEQLAETTFLPFTGGQAPASQLTEMVLIGHYGMHLAGIQAAAG